MSQIISAVCVVAFSIMLRKPIEKMPVVFYALCAATAIAAAYLTFNPAPEGALRTLAFAIQKGHVGFAFLALVMYVGIFDEASSVRRALAPVRAELAIMGAILMAAHFFPYLMTYLGSSVPIGALKPSVIVSLAVAVVVLALLLLLTITSFRAVKKRMDAKTWKNVQKLAYPFFALIYLHLIGYLAIPLLAGSPDAIVAVGYYTVVFALYALLRLRRARENSKAIK